MAVADDKKVRALLERIPKLGTSQILAIETIVDQLERPSTLTRLPTSDIVSECVLREFGDTLRIHHCFSAQAFTKDKFEFALEKVINVCGGKAHRSRRGKAGDDITIDGVPTSLKTQADAGIKVDSVHISKFMEMGKGVWGEKLEDVPGLRDRFFDHMTSYDRIFTLRRLSESPNHVYELVEIPKKLLKEAKDGELEMRFNSTQFPKPAYCTVRDKQGGVKFQLYFDGGTERKLQIKNLSKALCTVHATWSFPAVGEATIL